MLIIQQLKFDQSVTDDQLIDRISTELKINRKDILDFSIIKKSIDARKKPFIIFLYSVSLKLDQNLEMKLLRNKRLKNLTVYEPVTYTYPNCNINIPAKRPVIIGAGPAGLFCGYVLARYGCRPIIIERGQCVEERCETVQEFWKSGVLNVNSNVQFGEGGAGTFSDGKLNTAIHDKNGIVREVLKLFVQFGAPEDILYDAKPHIGTDILISVVQNIRNEIRRLNGEIRFSSLMTDYHVTDNHIDSITVLDLSTGHNELLLCDRLILAIGHSARDLFELLYQKGIQMSQKSFAVGLRVMHSQNLIDRSQYGCLSDEKKGLPTASYKLTAQTSNQKSVYTFCMCPGGYVVNASSEAGYLAINGMSYHDRGSKIANSAVIVTVDSSDFGSDNVLAGMEFQRNLEKKAFQLANGKIPMQYLKDFTQQEKEKQVVLLTTPVEKSALSDGLNSTDSEPNQDLNEIPAVKGACTFADVASILPQEIKDSITEAFPYFGRCIHGFDDPNTVLCAIESRTSSPVRIERDEQFNSTVKGLLPCGEGAGYAGGITSAAADGIRVACSVINGYAGI